LGNWSGIACNWSSLMSLTAADFSGGRKTGFSPAGFPSGVLSSARRRAAPENATAVARVAQRIVVVIFMGCRLSLRGPFDSDVHYQYARGESIHTARGGRR